jgi:putative copper resistance protein D
MDGPAWILLRALARGLNIAGSFTNFGTMFLAAALCSPPFPTGLKKLAWASLAVALLSGAVWFLLQTGDFASAQNLHDVLFAIPIVAGDTRFGAILLGRAAALCLATLLFQAGFRRLAALAGFSAVLAEAWLGHGGAMSGPVGWMLLITSFAHLTSAAAWLGALPALVLVVECLPAEAGATLLRKFSTVGVVCVATLIVTATIQYRVLIGGVGALFTSAYGLTASLKILLLLVLIALAARNRLVLTPALPASKASLLRSIRWEIAFGLLVLLAAALILQLEPPAMAAMAN